MGLLRRPSCVDEVTAMRLCGGVDHPARFNEFPDKVIESIDNIYKINIIGCRRCQNDIVIVSLWGPNMVSVGVDHPHTPCRPLNRFPIRIIEDL